MLALLIVFLVTLVAFILLFLFFYSVFYFIDRKASKDNLKIKVSQLKKIYPVTYKRWKFIDYCHIDYNIRSASYFSPSSTIHFYIGYFDTFRYFFFRRKVKKENLASDKREKEVLFLEDIQRQINKYRKDNLDYLEDKIRRL